MIRENIYNAEIKKEIIHSNILRYNYYLTESAENKTSFASSIEMFDISSRVKECLSINKSGLSHDEIFFAENICKGQFNPGGYASWSPAYELFSNQKQPALKTKVIPQWNCYINFPGTLKSDYSQKNILGQFVIYFRFNGKFFVIASTGNVTDKNPVTDLSLEVKNCLPPVQYVISRKKNVCKITVADMNRKWNKNEVISQICYFIADDFVEAKAKLELIFGSSLEDNKNYSSRFDQVQHLGKICQGWESWYNHYADIDEKLILDDLDALQKTENLISLHSKTVSEPAVFQIDDGWEEALGQWEWRQDRFPSGPVEMVKKIKAKGYIPGLWMAPFIIDLRSKTAVNHPDWILKDADGKPVPAGYNPLWGAKKGEFQPCTSGTFFCLDLSNEHVLEHLDNIMEKAVEEWGFEYLKLDFLYAGMLNGKFKKDGAAYEYYDKAIKILTGRRKNHSGKNICYLGCGAPFESSFNDFPLTRIGCDTLENWENKICKRINWNGRTSAYLNMQDSIGRSIWNKIIYLNDPDVIFIRNQNCSLTRDEKLLIATVAFMFGSQLMYSDDPGKSCSEEEVALAKEILLLKEKYYGKIFDPVPLKPDVYLAKELKTGNGYILNLSDRNFSYDKKTVKKHSVLSL